ncbi:hypothetical protein [Marinobacter sp. AC-23]|uniref:hypothetical protein n=1 Tax=Marinobacter sp. AC-23 TaxID=1879031 RepID=UPI0020C86230|nr:hypothetical protein [Marinobacter sp. AC-23]
MFSLAALVLMEGNAFFAALSKGFTAAAFIMFLLAFVRNVARKKGLGESHFHWNPNSLLVIRREIPLLMAFVIPVTIITTSTSSTPEAFSLMTAWSPALYSGVHRTGDICATDHESC